MPDAVSTLPLAEWIDPAELFSGVDGAHAFWLDAGADAVDGWSWLGEGRPVPTPDPPCHPAARTSASETGAAEVGPFRGGHVGWSGYDAAARRAGAPATVDDTVPQEMWLEVACLVAFDHARRRVWLIAPREHLAEFERTVARWRSAAAARTSAPTHGVPDAAGEAHPATARVDPDEYAERVERCRAAIRRGDAYQLCLTTRFEVSARSGAIDPLAVFLRLRAAASSHHGALIRSGEHALVSASPERFVRVAGGVVATSPIKGTRPRGVAPAADLRLARELVESPKERAENVMIVDLMRNDLQRVCVDGSVAVTALLDVESYATVHQLVSSVAGRLRPGIRLSDVLSATFPAGSMTGAPKLSAMTLLHAIERAPRGVFAGCFGWVGPDGSADLAMVIRSVVVHPGGAYVGAGGGITWGSDPAAEVAEVAVKARAPLAALGSSLPPRWEEWVR